MKLTYNGPQESRTLELPAGPLPIEKGKPFDVPDEVGKQLLEQGYFKKSAAKRSGGKKKTAAKKSPAAEPVEGETAQAAAGAKESE